MNIYQHFLNHSKEYEFYISSGNGQPELSIAQKGWWTYLARHIFRLKGYQFQTVIDHLLKCPPSNLTDKEIKGFYQILREKAVRYASNQSKIWLSREEISIPSILMDRAGQTAISGSTFGKLPFEIVRIILLMARTSAVACVCQGFYHAIYHEPDKIWMTLQEKASGLLGQLVNKAQRQGLSPFESVHFIGLTLLEMGRTQEAGKEIQKISQTTASIVERYQLLAKLVENQSLVAFFDVYRSKGYNSGNPRINVDLSGLDLDKQAERIKRFFQASSRYVSQNPSLDLSEAPKLAIIPAAIQDFKSLRSLNLYNHRIFLSLEVWSLKLTTLNLVNACISEMPPEVGQLSSLIHLDLNQNNLSALPSTFESLSQLETLELSRNNFTEWPEEIVKLKNLQSLGCSGNLLKRIPKEIEALNQLQKLNLSSNKIEIIIEEIWRLPHLKKLNLSFNQIKKVVAAISHAQQLEKLDLRDNEITEISCAIETLQNLKKLDIASNLDLKSFSIRNLKKIEVLALSIPCYRTLNLSDACQLTNLKRLKWNSGKITQIPKEIQKLKKLEILDLGWNQISQIPKEVASLPNLREIHLRDNPIQANSIQFPSTCKVVLS